MLFSQGPWTPWQMLCWGLIGLLAGKLFFGKKPALWQVCLFGGAAVFGIFALIMNPASLLMIQAVSSADSLLAAYIALRACDASFERECAALQGLSAGKPAPMQEKPFPTNVLRADLYAAAIVFIVLGVMNGGLYDVLVKAINICTECIGLG